MGILLKKMNFKSEKGTSSTDYIILVVFAMVITYFALNGAAEYFNFKIPIIGGGVNEDEFTKIFDSFSALQIILIIPGILALFVLAMIISAAIGVGLMFAFIGLFWVVVEIAKKFFFRSSRHGTHNHKSDSIAEPNALSSTSTSKAAAEILQRQKEIARDDATDLNVSKNDLLVGFRRWSVENNSLIAFASSYAWRSKLEISECNKCGDESPKESCSCGLYAWDITNFNYSDIYMSRRDTLNNLLNKVIDNSDLIRHPESIEAIVVGSGRAHVHSEDGKVVGWRCQNQQIIGFISYNDISEEALKNLCKRYQVPMIRTRKELKTTLEHLQSRTSTKIPIEQIINNLSIENYIRRNY